MNTQLKNRLAFYKAEAAKRGNNPWHDGKKRWIENTNSIGLRFVCYADQELSYLRHNGYFADHFQDQILRGAVWQLPGRNGSPLYVYGYKDPNNEGAAHIEFDYTDDKRNAAEWADAMAEREAEQSREYYAKDAAEQDIFNARETIHQNNRDALALIREIKQAEQFTPAVCGALKSELRRMLERRAEQFALIIKRENDFWSAVEDFWSAVEDLWSVEDC